MERDYLYSTIPKTRAKRKKKRRMGFCAKLTVIILLILLGALLQKSFDALSRQINHTSQPPPISGTSAVSAKAAGTAKPDKPGGEFLTLVNQWHPLSGTDKPALTEVENGYRFDARAAESLKQMLRDARAEGLSPMICSAYRSNENQTQLYKKQVDKQMGIGLAKAEAEEKARSVVAYPGTSEHELGLAVDIVAKSYQMLDDRQSETGEARWLKQNCARYGFILRYPADKSDRTGVIFEPWHYRYVGKEAAQEIMRRGVCLEEYLED